MSELVPVTSAPPSLFSQLAGVTAPVGRQLYASAGFGLMGVKYVVEAAFVYAYTQTLYPLYAFLSPLASVRVAPAGDAPEWLFALWALWTLPFAWIGVSMSVRRARDAGLPAFFGLFFFVPFLNFLFLLLLAAMPSRVARPITTPLRGEDRVLWAALTGVGGGALLGVGMTMFSVFVLGEYGNALFVGTPAMMGMVAGFLLNARSPQGLLPNLIVGALTVAISGSLLLLTALEGIICLMMAAPLVMPLALLGVFLGAGLARVEAQRALAAPLGALPFLGIAEPPPAQERIVETTVDIAAPPEAVWDAVIGFGGVELPEPPEWYFHTGIAYPIRARIEGDGVGAVRYCEFSTGPFVEPITTWDPPHHLAFDVRESPPTMHEWSPYNTVYAPHLDGVLKSRRGEFVLTALDDGGTRLTGRTVYTFDMAPEPFWGLWSDASIHAIHLRVLHHIAGVVEGEAR